MYNKFSYQELGGIGELLIYDKLYTHRWEFWLKNKREIEDLIITLINKESYSNEVIQEDILEDKSRLDEIRKEIPKINFQKQPNKETLEMIYNCLDYIDDLSNCRNFLDKEIREYHRFYVLCVYISSYIGVNNNLDLTRLLSPHSVIDLTELFEISDFLKYPYDYLGFIYERLLSSKLKNINLRPINTTSNYGLIISHSTFEFPLIADQNVETGRRLLALSNDYLVLTGQSCSVIETIITQINLQVFAPWVISLGSYLEFINYDDMSTFIKEMNKDYYLEFSYLYPNYESTIRDIDYYSFLDYSLLNGYRPDYYLSVSYNSMPIIIHSKKTDENFNKIPEIQYFPLLLSLK